jgi:hypothetical protein
VRLASSCSEASSFSVRASHCLFRFRVASMFPLSSTAVPMGMERGKLTEASFSISEAMESSVTRSSWVFGFPGSHSSFKATPACSTTIATARSRRLVKDSSQNNVPQLQTLPTRSVTFTYWSFPATKPSKLVDNSSMSISVFFRACTPSWKSLARSRYQSFR